MYLAQIETTFNAISKFVEQNGVLVFLLVVAALTVAAAIGGLVYALIKIVQMMGKMQDNSAKRDEKLNELDQGQDQLKQTISQTKSATEVALNGVATGLADISKNVKEAGSAYTSTIDQIAHTINDQISALSETGKDIKTNSNNNTNQIIQTIDEITIKVANELKEPLDKVESAVSGLTELIKSQVMSLEERAILAEREKAALAFRLAQLQAVNVGASTDPDHTIPMSQPFKLPNNPDAGDDNRKEIDDTKSRIEAAERAKMVDAASAVIDKPQEQPK